MFVPILYTALLLGSGIPSVSGRVTMVDHVWGHLSVMKVEGETDVQTYYFKTRDIVCSYKDSTVPFTRIGVGSLVRVENLGGPIADKLFLLSPPRNECQSCNTSITGEVIRSDVGTSVIDVMEYGKYVRRFKGITPTGVFKDGERKIGFGQVKRGSKASLQIAENGVPVVRVYDLETVREVPWSDVRVYKKPKHEHIHSVRTFSLDEKGRIVTEDKSETYGDDICPKCLRVGIEPKYWTESQRITDVEGGGFIVEDRATCPECKYTTHPETWASFNIIIRTPTP